MKIRLWGTEGQGRTSSLRCGRSTLTLIFHGKVRRLSGATSTGHVARSWATRGPHAPSSKQATTINNGQPARQYARYGARWQRAK